MKILEEVLIHIEKESAMKTYRAGEARIHQVVVT